MMEREVVQEFLYYFGILEKCSESGNEGNVAKYSIWMATLPITQLLADRT